jgi:agmatine deiminase
MDRLMPRYRMPAEWEPHEGTWIAWPHEKTDWPGKFQTIPWVYCEIVRHLARVERVHILVNDEDAEQRARKALVRAHVDMSSVDFFRCPTNRSWTRELDARLLPHLRSRRTRPCRDH